MSSSSNYPGCFGSPLCCQVAQQPCNVCPLASQCQPQADARAARLKARYGLDAFLGAPRRARTDAGVAKSSVPGVNKKSVEMIEGFRRKGIDLPAAVRRGENPFERSPPAFMRIAVGALMQGGIERSDLKHRFVSELGWAETSAGSHVSIATSALVSLGVANQVGNRMVLA